MAKLGPMGNVDSRKELEKFLRGITDEDVAKRLRLLIMEYALQRELEVLEDAKELVNGDSKEWIDLESLSKSVLLSTLPEKF